MNTQAKKYKVTIFGESYILVSDEPEQHVVELAYSVDKLMSGIAQASGSNDAKKLAVLAALQFASELKQLKTNHEVREQGQSHLNDLLDQELSKLI